MMNEIINCLMNKVPRGKLEKSIVSEIDHKYHINNTYCIRDQQVNIINIL